MRAIYLENLTVESEYILRGEAFHHLVHVARVKLGEEILLLNGQGLEMRCEIVGISKRELSLKTLEHLFKKLKFRVDILLAMPKKDALDLCLKQVVELGIHTTYLVSTQFSQMKCPEKERLQKLLVSALEQSNSPHLTHVISLALKEIDYSAYDQVLVLDSQHPGEQPNFAQGRLLLVVGPEGGFSPEEFAFFDQLPNLCRLHLPTPIMRTPTALSCGVGVILQRLMN